MTSKKDVEAYLQELINEIDKQNQIYVREFNSGSTNEWPGLIQGLYFKRNLQCGLDIVQLLYMAAPHIFENVERKLNEGN